MDWNAPYRPLLGEDHLAYWPEACLAIRGGDEACDQCARACPVRALKVGADGTALVGDCLHCGRCVAACPTGALSARGFEPQRLPSGNRIAAIECWKVSRRLSVDDALRVPCLGGIPISRIVEILAEQGTRLMFIDRGWCLHCRAGDGRFAGESLLERLAPWLQACGLARERWPEIRLQPLPRALMPEEIPRAEQELAMGRRAFFVRLGREIAHLDRPAEPPPGPRAVLRRKPCPMPERQRFLAALERLATEAGRPLPVSALPRLIVSEACRDHGLCVGVCPTGALQREHEAGKAVLRFTASACTSCRRCVASCPEGALRLDVGGAKVATVLRAFALKTCLECGGEFAAAGGETACPACRNKAFLARSLFSDRVGSNVAEQSLLNPSSWRKNK